MAKSQFAPTSAFDRDSKKTLPIPYGSNTNAAVLPHTPLPSLPSARNHSLQKYQWQSSLTTSCLESLFCLAADHYAGFDRDSFHPFAFRLWHHYRSWTDYSGKREYDQLLSWADLYDKSSFEAKKMIVSQFIKAVRVGRDYNIEVDFNVSFEELQNYRADNPGHDKMQAPESRTA